MVLQRESHIGMGVPLGIQAYRETAIGISWKYIRGCLSFTANTEYEEKADDGSDDIAEVQAGYGSNVA